MTELTGMVLWYRIDAVDRIVAVSDNWLLFARRNGAPHLAPDAVLGQSLWGFISDQETVALSRMIFDHVRRQAMRVDLPFRCDSPHSRRDLQMSVRPHDGHDLDIRTEIVREEQRPYMPLFDPAAPCSDETIIACSWCKRIQTATQVWVEVDVAVQELGLFDAPLTPQVSHGICPDCFDQTRAQLAGGDTKDRR